MAAFSETIDLFVFPSGVDVVVSLQSQTLDVALEGLRTWIRDHGYVVAGPPLLAWNEWAMREVRQPILPIFALKSADGYHVIERPELLVAELLVPLAETQFNLAGIYDQVREYNLDPLGAPYIPLGTNSALVSGAMRGFVPVVPAGTRSLIPLHSWLSTKLGLIAPRPRLGEQLPRGVAWQQSGLLVVRGMILAVLMMIVLLPLCIGCAWLSATIAGAGAILGGLVIGLLGSVGLLMILIGLLVTRLRLQAIRRWNRFWAALPTPPLVILGEEFERVSEC